MSEKKHSLHPGFILGWLFVALAFIGAAHEGTSGYRGIVSAEQLWYAKAPGSLITSQIKVERLLGEGSWAYTFGLPLLLPIWALFGIPAGFCLLRYRPHKEVVDYEEAERAHDYADMLARNAKEDGAADDIPRWADLEDMDTSEHPEIKTLEKAPLDHYMDQWEPEAVDGEDLEGLTRGSHKDIRSPGEIESRPLGIHDLEGLKLGDGKGRRLPGDLPQTSEEETTNEKEKE